MPNLAQVIEQAWKVGKVEPRLDPATNSVGTSAVEILPNNPRRLAALIVNLSPNSVWVKPLADPSSSSGVLVPANGGTFSLIWSEDFHLVGYQWRAIASGLASSVLVIELNAL